MCGGKLSNLTHLLIKKLFINNIVSISHFIVTNKDVDIRFPPPPAEPSVQLSVGKHWIRKVQPNPLVALALSLVKKKEVLI